MYREVYSTMNNVIFESTSPPSKNKSGLDGSRCNVLRIPALDGLRYGIPYRSSSFRDRTMTMTMTIRASCVICTRTRNAMKRKQRIIFSLRPTLKRTPAFYGETVNIAAFRKQRKKTRDQRSFLIYSRGNKN